jgi:hypothetical protein
VPDGEEEVYSFRETKWKRARPGQEINEFTIIVGFLTELE